MFFVFCERGEQVLNKRLFKNSHLSEDGRCPQDDIPLGKSRVRPACSMEVFKLHFIPKKASTWVTLHSSPLLMLVVYPLIAPERTVSVSVMTGITLTGISTRAVKESKCTTTLCRLGAECVSQLLGRTYTKELRKQATVLAPAQSFRTCPVGVPFGCWFSSKHGGH